MTTLTQRLLARTAPTTASSTDTAPAIAHLLRRTSFGPFPGQVSALVDKGYEACLDGILSAGTPTADKPSLAGDDAHGSLRNWWLDRLVSVTATDPLAGLHERMVWLWHGHFTSGFDKVDNVEMMWNQHALFRQHALGSFRDMARAVTKDAAMLRYLDGDGSPGDAPNENYSRELMELFTLGRGHYTESDVRSGAQALSGWYVDQAGIGRFDEGNHFDGTVTFLGRSGRMSADDVIDAVCAHEACAPFVAHKLHAHFVGSAPSKERLIELAKIFSAGNLEIKPLVEAILRHESLRTARYTRPRLPSEWITAVTATLKLEGDTVRDLRNAGGDLGQILFEPPNVAGWPGSSKWVNAGNSITRGSRAVNLCLRDEAIRPSATVDGVLAHCGLFEISQTTRNGLDDAASRIPGDKERAQVLLALAITSPEFALA